VALAYYIFTVGEDRYIIYHSKELTKNYHSQPEISCSVYVTAFGIFVRLVLLCVPLESFISGDAIPPARMQQMAVMLVGYPPLATCCYLARFNALYGGIRDVDSKWMEQAMI
jgi:hypothetical protein